MIEDSLTPREAEILKHIRRYGQDISHDYFDMGYDEGYEAKDGQEDYDRGWNKALEAVMEMVQKTGIVYTPISAAEVKHQIEVHKDNGPLCVMFYMNYLADQIESMEQ